MKTEHTPAQKWTLGNVTGTIFKNGDPTGFELKIYNERIPSAELLHDANAAPELLSALESTEAKLTILLCSRLLDSTTLPFLTLRTERDSIRAVIARTKGGES